MNIDNFSPGMSRRQLLAGGMGLAGTALVAGCGTSLSLSAVQGDPRVDGRPSFPEIFEGPVNSTDPAAHSRIENLFWLPRMADHAWIFARLLPGLELTKDRNEAILYEGRFNEVCQRAREIKFARDEFEPFNRSVIELVKRFVDWKFQMREAQAGGRLHSLVWPSFFEGAALEGQRFIRKLGQFNSGSIELERREVVEFWSHDTAGHLAMIGHLLDPNESRLVQEAVGMAAQWKTIGAPKPGTGGPDPVLQAEHRVLEFKSKVARGIEQASIQSILHPRMVEHMKLEGLRFVDELKRSA